VITIETDQTGVLKGGQWAFSLVLDSDQFVAGMQEHWSGVKVYLGEEKGKNLWQLAAEWNPDVIP
jgi:hypothetical protein